jgi:hypothetical protein
MFCSSYQQPRLFCILFWPKFASLERELAVDDDLSFSEGVVWGNLMLDHPAVLVTLLWFTGTHNLKGFI